MARSLTDMSLGLVVDVDGAVGWGLLQHPLRGLRRLAGTGPQGHSVLGLAGIVIGILIMRPHGLFGKAGDVTT